MVAIKYFFMKIASFLMLFGFLLLSGPGPVLADDGVNSEGGDAAEDEEYREVGWEDLMPADWEPPPFQYPVYEFGDEEEDELTNGIAPGFVIEDAPVVEELNQQKLKIPGYVIPIEYDDVSVSEFLLVPYLGACIHVPPPPTNQMVYVRLKEPMSSGSAWSPMLWDPVWVSGLLKTEKMVTEYTPVSYSMDDASVTEYYY